MPFASQDDGIARLSTLNGAHNRRTAIRNNVNIGPDRHRFSLLRYACQNIINNLAGIFGAGIISGDNDVIGKAGCDCPHEGPLAAIAITATAKQTDQAPRCHWSHSR